MDLNMQTIGERIKRRRLELNLTQTQIKGCCRYFIRNLSGNRKRQSNPIHANII